MFDAQQIDIKKLLDDVSAGNAMIVDVRTPAEYQMSHAEGAINIELNRILQGDVSLFKKDVTLYLYCASGNRSGVAQQALQAKGYTAYNVGGLSHWQALGGRVVYSANNQ